MSTTDRTRDRGAPTLRLVTRDTAQAAPRATSDPHSEHEVLAHLADELRAAAERLPIDSGWRSWIVSRERTLRDGAGLRGMLVRLPGGDV